MREKYELEFIVEMLTQWLTAVKLRNSVNDTGINRTSENLVLRLLNAAYDYDLVNLNWEDSQYPAVDLGDRELGITFQVTSTKTLNKIKESLKKFYMEGGPHKDFPGGIYFFFLTEKPPNLNAETKQKLQKIAPCFNADQQMWSINKLLTRIEELYSKDRERFFKLKEILKEEFGYSNKKISNRHLMEELYRGSKRYLSSLRGVGGRFRYINISETLLAPTKHSKRKEWLDTLVSVNGENIEPTVNVLSAVPLLWEADCPHALLKGEGGMGKTVSFIRLWEQYIADDNYNPLLPLPVFIPLNEYNETDESERKRFIQRMIRKFYLNENTRQKELLDVFRESSDESIDEAPSVIVMLDGLNEVTVERTALLVEIREIIEHWKGVQILISSRPDMRDTMGWSDFHILELVGLNKEQIEKYLEECNFSIFAEEGHEREYPLGELLQNPMMLTIYVASCEMVKEYRATSLYEFKVKVETTGELLWNFIEAQVVKYTHYGTLEKQKKIFYRYLLKILLPNLGFEMERLQQFQLADRELKSILENAFKRYCREDFFSTFPDYLECSDAWDIDDCKQREALKKMSRILKILSSEMSMLVREGNTYRFLHQNFRDFFAAVYILNEIKMGIYRDEVSQVLTGGMISFNLLRYMGEIEGEHYCKPYFEEGKGWQIKSNDSALLSQALSKCRDHFNSNYAYAVANIIDSWKLLRGELSGIDLSWLDLSKMTLNGVRFNRFYKKSYLNTCFDHSLINERNLLPQGHFAQVNKAVYSPNGKKILSASWDLTIKEWDIETGNYLNTYIGHSDYVNSAVYSSDGRKILSASCDKSIKEWDIRTGKCLNTYIGHSGYVNSAVYSSDMKKILSASNDKTIKEWDIETGKCLRTLKGHTGSVSSAFYNSDNNKILSASFDQTTKLWDVKTGRCIKTYKGHSSMVTIAVFSRNEKKILSASGDDTIIEWDVKSGEILKIYAGHSGSINSATYSPDEKKILSASGNKTITEWDVETGVCLRTYKGHSDVVVSAIYDLTGHKILSASDDYTIKEWSVETGECLKDYKGFSHEISSVLFSIDGKRILSASWDHTIKEWDVKTGKCIRIYHGHVSKVTSATYCPNGKKILSASHDKAIKEWNVETGECLKTYLGHSDFVNNAIYSLNGKKILSASSDKSIKEWDTETGKCLKTYIGHFGYINSAVYSPNGKKILSASNDKTIKEWDTETGKCLKTYSGEIYPVENAVYDYGGSEIISSSLFGLLKRWDIKTGKCLATFTGPLHNDQQLTWKNRFIKVTDIEDSIVLIDIITKEKIMYIKNVPGLFFQNCSFRNLHPDSDLSDESRTLMKQYGAVFK